MSQNTAETKNGLLFLIAFSAFVAACSAGIYDGLSTQFSSSVDGDALPWKHENFDSEEGKFTFAVFADLTGGERSSVFDAAIAQLNLLRPEFIINVGDLIDGGAADVEQLTQQWESFDNRASNAKAPVFYVGGNHDLTGDALRAVWALRNGPTYYYFVYKNSLFIVLDTEDNTAERQAEILAARNAAMDIFSKDGPEAFRQTKYWMMPERTSGFISKKQSEYVVEAIQRNRDVRWTFLFVHKPAWKTMTNSAFADIEQALMGRPYTVFNGHVHAYDYEQRYGMDYIQLATTGGAQFPALGRSEDHITLVTVDSNGVDIANVMLSGIFDKTGRMPLDTGEMSFEVPEFDD
jgi:hypothetical protein